MVHSLKSKFWGSVRLSVVIALWALGGQTLNGRVKGDAKVHIYTISWLWLTIKTRIVRWANGRSEKWASGGKGGTDVAGETKFTIGCVARVSADVNCYEHQ